MEIRIAGIVRESVVDGPGLRLSVFTQGCPHHCKGCHNPTSHPLDGGIITSTEKIFAVYAQNPYLAGITLTGGEPILQPEACLDLATKVTEQGGNVVLFSGYTFEELLELGKENTAILSLLSRCFLLIDGKFVLEQRDLSLPLAGSRNQRVIDLQKSLQQSTPILYSL